MYLSTASDSIPLQTKRSIIFVSDTQQPIWVETLLLQEHDNEKATRMIYRTIERETTAVGIFHLGDITSVGMVDSYWKSFDEFQKKIHVPIYPAIGNHDYFFFNGYALEQFQKRFPKMNPTWYSVVITPVAVIVLNSNFSQLTDEERIKQQEWYWNQLSQFDSDSVIRSIIVVCHHSPYTNSTIVHPSQGAQRHFLTPFLMFRKTSMFISGHAHAYEHFRVGEKELLVIGGGGGLLHPLLIKEEQRYHDIFSQQLPLRFFHYLQCTLEKNSLVFSVKKLRNDFSGFDVVDSIFVQYSK